MPLVIYDTSTNPAAPLGSEITIGMNRVFRYAKNGPGDIAVGTVLQAARPNDCHANMTCAALDAGRTAITVTMDRGDPMDRDEYKEGHIYINDEAGEEADMIDAFSGTLPRELVMLTQARRQLERLEMVSEKDLRGLIAHAASCRSESRLR